MAYENLISDPDPRNPLQKARRTQLVQFAKARGFTDVSEAMTAHEIRLILEMRGVTDIQPFLEGRVQENKDMQRKFAENEQHKETASIASMTRPEMMRECKARGIKTTRTDNLETLREKLGQNAA